MTKPNRSVLRSKNMLRKAYIELYTLYLKSEIDLSLAQINEEINKMFLAGMRLYQ